MDARRLSAFEQGTLWAAAGILARRRMSFEQATNGVLEQPPPLDNQLRDATQHFSFQGTDAHSSAMLFSGQDALNTIFQTLHGRQGPDCASPNPQPAVAPSGSIVGECPTEHEICQSGRDSFRAESNFEEFLASNFHPPPALSASTVGSQACVQHVNSTRGDFGSLSSDFLPSMDAIGSDFKSSGWSNGQSSPFSGMCFNYYLPGNGLNGRSEITYMPPNYQDLSQNLPCMSLAPEPPSTVVNQCSASDPAYGLNEMHPFILASDNPSLHFAEATGALQLQDSKSSGSSGGRKRKQEQVSDIDSIAVPPFRKKKRGPFATAAQKEQTAETRELGACIRCARQHIRCIPDSTDRRGACQSCQQSVTRRITLQCIRAKITESTLFRQIVDPGAGRPDFSINFDTGILRPIKEWNPLETRTIELTQGFNSILRFRVRKAEIFDFTNMTESQRQIYKCPWSLVDIPEAVNEVGNFIDRSIIPAVTTIVSENDKLARKIFEVAYRMTREREDRKPSEFLLDVLRLWTASRCIEGGWRFKGSETLGVPAANKGTILLTDAPIIDGQQSSIIVLNYLSPLRQCVLEKMQELTSNIKNRRRHWFQLFLANFILLHSLECVMKQQRNWARENKSQTRYTQPMMGLVRGVLFASKTLLSHFHYDLRGQDPFHLNWDPKSGAKFAELNDDQRKFVRFVAGEVEKKRVRFSELYKNTEFETDYWFTGQLFNTDWKPPRTEYD